MRRGYFRSSSLWSSRCTARRQNSPMLQRVTQDLARPRSHWPIHPALCLLTFFGSTPTSDAQRDETGAEENQRGGFRDRRRCKVEPGIRRTPRTGSSGRFTRLGVNVIRAVPRPSKGKVLPSSKPFSNSKSWKVPSRWKGADTTTGLRPKGGIFTGPVMK